MGLIRLLLALSVVAAHFGSIFGTGLVGGQIAVQSFFIISGFYMSLILNEKYIGVNNSYRLFISNRFIRLYPVFWAVLLLTVLGCLAVALLTHGESLTKFESYVTVKTNIFSFLFLILTNIVIFGQDLVMFLGINPENGHLFFTSNFQNSTPPLHSFLFIPQAWTLGLELMFYLIAPFILRKGLKWVLAIIVSSFLLRLFLYNGLHFQNDPWTYRFFPTEILFFLLGYVSYRMYVRMKETTVSGTVNWALLGAIILFTVFYEHIPALRISGLPFSVKECVYFAAIIGAIPLLFQHLKRSKWDNQIGELSYPIYISHILVGMFFQKLHVNSGWIIALATILFSFLLNRFIASPIEKYRQSRLKSQ